VNQLNLSAYIVASRYLEIYADGFSSVVSSGTDGGRVGVVFISSCKCWDLATELEKQARPDNTRFTVTLRVTGIGERAQPNAGNRRGYERLYQ